MYKTIPAINTVKMRPGTRPRIEYDQGKDIIARQMYSEKRSAAVLKLLVRVLMMECQGRS